MGLGTVSILCVTGCTSVILTNAIFDLCSQETRPSASQKKQDTDVAKRQAALYSMASSPLMQAGTMIMMMWFSGSQLNFFSIMATLNGLYSPIKAIMKAGTIFKPDAEGKLDVFSPRMLYSLIHGGVVLFALHKINVLGLLPTRLGDWVSSIQAPDVKDHAVPGML